MFETLLAIHFLSLATGLGISITMFVLGLAAAKLPPAEAGPLMGRVALAVRPVAIGGITLLILSGIALVGVGGEEVAEAGGWWFRAKLVCATIVVVGFVMIQVYQGRARRGENPPASIRKAMLTGRLSLAAGVAATILAVVAFG